MNILRTYHMKNSTNSPKNSKAEIDIFERLASKKTKLAVIGLGYVGLPLAIEFSKRFSVIGYDLNDSRIKMMNLGIDPSKELPASAFSGNDIVFTSDREVLKEASFFIVAVPTPVDLMNKPDLRPVVSASNTIGNIIKKGDYIVYESTVYPGCTEEDCLPILENLSGLKLNDDFKLGYSPERINPGDKQRTLRTVIKVVSGSDSDSLDQIAKVYETVVDAGVFKAKSIMVAEASKVIENTQRDLNIALMNELSLIFDKMNINTYDVLEAAGTKWNFLKFSPGLVGGHCIGVDPYYLTSKAASLGYEAKVITASRFINDNMARNVARKIIRHVLRTTPDLNKASVLVKGVTFKENVSDIRNSKIIDTVKEILAFNIKVDIEDPYADGEEVLREYGLRLANSVGKEYDAVLITVPHDTYLKLEEDHYLSITKPTACIADLKGIMRNKIKQREYWTL
jgi:UDP-N-acetyl-D-galactosamine dehydrogenase